MGNGSMLGERERQTNSADGWSVYRNRDVHDDDGTETRAAAAEVRSARLIDPLPRRRARFDGGEYIYMFFPSLSLL